MVAVFASLSVRLLSGAVLSQVSHMERTNIPFLSRKEQGKSLITHVYYYDLNCTFPFLQKTAFPLEPHNMYLLEDIWLPHKMFIADILQRKI